MTGLFDAIETLEEQLETMLNLLRGCEDVDDQYINTAADMCLTLLDELCIHFEEVQRQVRKMEDERKQAEE